MNNSKVIYTHIVPNSIKNIRLQNYAPTIFSVYIPSNSGIKKAIKRNQFLVNGTIAETGTWVNSGDVIDFVENPNHIPKVYNFNLIILFEDEHLAAIYKPAGIIVSGNTFKTIANALPFNLKKSVEPDALFTPTPVHRLDNQTSGILLIAKTKTAQIELGKQFSNKTIQKKYNAIVIGKTTENQTITTPVNNKPSETVFETLEVFKSLKYKELSLLKVTPKTGRTHQIRIHLASINHPILGDKLYGNPETIHKGKGLFLSATELQFLHPKTFETINLKIEIPQKFTSIINLEKRRWKTYNG